MASPMKLLGTFEIPRGPSVFGELLLNGRHSALSLRHDTFFFVNEKTETIRGTLHDLTRVTCLRCIPLESFGEQHRGPLSAHTARCFPHFIAHGDCFLDPQAAVIHSISFVVSDAYTLFYDWDAFGHLIDAKPHIEAIVKANSESIGRDIPVGPDPHIVYFTGRCDIFSVPTVLGVIAARHHPRWSLGDPSGVHIGNEIIVTIAPLAPINFDDALERTSAVLRFLSLAVGRNQGLADMWLEVGGTDGVRTQLQLHWSHPPARQEQRPGHPGSPQPYDLPLDPVGRRTEFESVLANWLEADPKRRDARTRFTGCWSKFDYYDADRIVAAANMFDLLPADAVPQRNTLPADLQEARDRCIEILDKLPKGIERDSALGALKRLKTASLPRKVLNRVAIVQRAAGDRYPELELVVREAVKCRNHYVHGSKEKIDYVRRGDLVAFLTDTLEFVFAASELVEAGWGVSPQSWEASGWGHPFARFRSSYAIGLAQLKAALGK